VYIETTPEDVEAAFDLLSDTLFRKADELSGACRATLEWIRSNEKGSFTAQAIRARLRMAPRTLSRYLGELTAYGYLVQDRKKKHSAGYVYTVASEAVNDLPEAIARQVAQVIGRVNAAASKPVEAPPIAGNSRKRTTSARKGVGQSAKVGQEQVGRPTEVDPSMLEQVGQSATGKQKRNEKSQAGEAAPTPPAA
jgi:hypothetical protein